MTGRFQFVSFHRAVSSRKVFIVSLHLFVTFAFPFKNIIKLAVGICRLIWLASQYPCLIRDMNIGQLSLVFLSAFLTTWREKNIYHPTRDILAFLTAVGHCFCCIEMFMCAQYHWHHSSYHHSILANLWKSQKSFLERYHVHKGPANEEGVRTLCKF